MTPTANSRRSARVLILGAAGSLGRHVLRQALAAGHEVSILVRDPSRYEVVGPAGPTTSRRMDKFMAPMLAHTGMLGSIGKSERGPAAMEAIRTHGGVHLIAVGGAAYLAEAIRAARVLAFPELGMEAVREFEVKDMPVTVAVDSAGNSIHETGPREWRGRIAKMPMVET